MTWVILIVSGMLEAVWATALSDSQGFKRPVLIAALVLSMAGLAVAMREISTGTAYAVWGGIGAALTVLWGVITGHEKATTARMLLLVVLIGSVVGLKVVS